MRFPFCCDIYVESLKTLIQGLLAAMPNCYLLLDYIRYSKVGTLVIAFYLTFTTILVADFFGSADLQFCILSPQYHYYYGP